MILNLIEKYKEEKRKYLDFLLSFGYDFFVWKPHWYLWYRVSELQPDEIIKAIELHREVLPQEYVFDIDAEDWNSCYELAQKLEERLNSWKIPFMRWSSGRFLHYHVFFDFNWLKEEQVRRGLSTKWYKTLIDVHFEALGKKEITNEDVGELTLEVHRAIPLLILKGFEQTEKAKIDLQKFRTTKVLIRFEGTRNEKTDAFKTFLPELPKEQPLIKASWLVKFPAQIQFWRPDPEVYHKLFVLAWEKFVKPDVLRGVRIFRSKNKNQIAWIEKILQTTFTDGRKRLIELVILPYLINFKKLPLEEAINITYEWALKNHETAPITRDRRRFTDTSLLKYIQYHAKRCDKTKLKPLSIKGVKKWFADCPEVLRNVLGQQAG